MAVKKRHPSWLNWQHYIEAALKQALKEVPMQGYRLNGQVTKLPIAVLDPNNLQSSQPFCTVLLNNVLEGWDDEMSGQENWEGRNYKSIGGGNLVAETKEITERLVFALYGYTQSYDQAIDIQQSIKRYFTPRNKLEITWQDASYMVDMRLGDYAMIPAEVGREGHNEFFEIRWFLTLYTKSDASAADTITLSVKDVAVETAILHLGGDDTNTVSYILEND